MAFTEGQVSGSIVALIIFLLTYIISLLFPLHHPEAGPIPFLTRSSSSIAIELTGDCINNKGIYFLPKRTEITDFLIKMNGEFPFQRSGEFAGIKLSSGKSILVLRNEANPPHFILGEMDAARKIALGLPIDINRASNDDIKLIPEVGEKTAARIIALRELSGIINDLDELMKIKGIKKKRLTKLKKYLYVDNVR